MGLGAPAMGRGSAFELTASRRFVEIPIVIQKTNVCGFEQDFLPLTVVDELGDVLRWPSSAFEVDFVPIKNLR